MHKVETNDNHYITKERKYARGKKGRKKQEIFTLFTNGWRWWFV